MPLALLEADAYNIPIIATNIENHREFIDNKYLCNIGDHRCFAEKVEKYSKIKRNLKFKCDYTNMLREYEALYWKNAKMIRKMRKYYTDGIENIVNSNT